MKRTFTLFLAALLLTGTLSGCNAASAAPSSSGGDGLNKEPPVMIFTRKGTGTEESFEVAASGYSWNWKNPSGSFSGVEADAVHPLDNNVLNFADRTEEPFDVSYIISFDLPPAALSYDRWSYGDIGDFDAPARESERLSMPYHMTVKKGSVYVFHVSFPASDQGGGTADYYLVTGPDAVIPEVKPVMEASASLSVNDGFDWLLDYRDAAARSREKQDGMAEFYEAVLPLLLKGGDESSVCSPLNVCLALSVLAETADGDTRQQLLDALRAPDLETLRRRARALREANVWDTGAFQSLIADSLWLSDSIPVKEATADAIAAEHGAEVFTGDPASEEYNEALRAWTDEATGGLLKEYALGMRMDPRMVMDLVSALYFKASWSEPFSPEATDDGIFHGTKGDAPCRMMHRSLSGAYYYGDGFAAVSLGVSQYGSMIFFLPDDGVQPEELLKNRRVTALLRGERDAVEAKYALINMSVPRFEVKCKTDLKGVLAELGVVDAFDPNKADFSPLTDATEVFLSKAEHAAALSIDEDGVTGAAYTDLGLCAAGMPQDTVDFTLDRPFLFAVTANDGSVVFAGVVRNTDK